MTKTRVPLHMKPVAMETTGMENNVTVTSTSEISADSSGVKLEYVTTSVEVAKVEPLVNVSSQLSVNTPSFPDSTGLQSQVDSSAGSRLSDGHSDFIDKTSYAAQSCCAKVEGMVGSLSDSVSGRQLPQASVICSGTSEERVTELPPLLLVTVASRTVHSVAPAMQMTNMNMTEQAMPVDSAHHCGASMVQISVFSTELANRAAESVRLRYYDSIVDYHQQYCALPASQNSKSNRGYISAYRPQANCYSEYRPSHPGDQATAVEEPTASYAPAGVEQWVRQQNACRQKQEQMAASSVYAGQVYRPCDQIPESECHRYWSGHLKPESSVDHARTHVSSVGFMGAARYGSMDSAMNLNYLCPENCKIPDNSLTLEQQQQRQSKMGWMHAIQQRLATDQQVSMSDEHVDPMTGASFPQSRVVPVGWNGVPCDDERYAGPYNSGSQMMTGNYSAAAAGRQFHLPSYNLMTSVQRKWYNMQRKHHMNQTGMQKNYLHCQQTDFNNSHVRYFSGACAPSQIPNDCHQFSVQGQGMPMQAIRDSTPAYYQCNPQVCMCDSHMRKQHHMLPSDVYGYTDGGLQPNYDCHQPVNRSREFMNDNYCMPFADGRQLTYSMLCRGQTDGIQNWNSGENVLRQRLLAAPVAQQFDAYKQRRSNNNACGADQNVAQPVSTTINCAPAQMPVVAVRQRQAGNSKKRKNNNNVAALSDAKSRKLDNTNSEWPPSVSASMSGTLMNITSASLAHLAKGVENISAVMQQSLEQGGPFQSVRRQSEHADGSDENANFIPAGNSLQIHAAGDSNLIDEKAPPVYDCTSVNSSLPTFQTASGNSRSSLTAVTTFSRVHSIASTTGIDIVVMSKAPYTISYRPTGISSSGDSVANVNTGNVSASLFNQDAGMMQPSNVERHMSNADTLSFSRRRVSSSGGFSQLCLQEQSRIACHKMPADGAKVDAEAAATDTCLSMASSVAVIQPQMMSGTQLFIADHCSESAPRLNSFVLPTGLSSSRFRSHQQPHLTHSMQQGPSH